MNESPEFEPSSHTLLGGELHPDSVSERQGLSYLEGWHVKAELNRVFGVDGWTYRPELNCVGTVEVSRFKAGDDGKRIETKGAATGYTALVELTIYTVMEPLVITDVGFGDSTMYTSSAAIGTHELASKEAVTDGLKRCAAKLGDLFGLGLYGDLGRKDIKARGRELASLQSLQEGASELAAAKLGRAPSSRLEKAKALGVLSRDLQDPAALSRLLP